MKNLLFFLFLSFSSSFFGQCPSAGADTTIDRALNEPFNLSQLITFDADLGGFFLDPSDNLIVNTNLTLGIQGEYPFQYVVEANGCLNDTAIVTVRINQAWYGINENSIEETNLASPNPVKDVLTINDNHFDNLQLFNSLGQRVFECEVLFSEEIDLSTFQNGLYLLRIERENKVYYQRILKE
jgi:hypothetical protein